MQWLQVFIFFLTPFCFIWFYLTITNDHDFVFYRNRSGFRDVIEMHFSGHFFVSTTKLRNLFHPLPDFLPPLLFSKRNNRNHLTSTDSVVFECVFIFLEVQRISFLLSCFLFWVPFFFLKNHYTDMMKWFYEFFTLRTKLYFSSYKFPNEVKKFLFSLHWKNVPVACCQLYTSSPFVLLCSTLAGYASTLNPPISQAGLRGKKLQVVQYGTLDMTHHRAATDRVDLALTSPCCYFYLKNVLINCCCVKERGVGCLWGRSRRRRKVDLGSRPYKTNIVRLSAPGVQVNLAEESLPKLIRNTNMSSSLDFYSDYANHFFICLFVCFVCLFLSIFCPFSGGRCYCETNLSKAFRSEMHNIGLRLQ